MVVGKLLLSHQLKAKSQDYTRYGSQRNSNNIKNNRSVIVANFVHCSGPKIKKKSTKRANYEHTFGQKRSEWGNSQTMQKNHVVINCFSCCSFFFHYLFLSAWFQWDTEFFVAARTFWGSAQKGEHLNESCSTCSRSPKLL